MFTNIKTFSFLTSTQNYVSTLHKSSERHMENFSTFKKYSKSQKLLNMSKCIYMCTHVHVSFKLS